MRAHAHGLGLTPHPPTPPQLLSQLFTGLCNGTIASSIGIGRILIAAAALLLVQLCLITDVCCFHPGDPSAWLTAEESCVVGPLGNTPSGVVVSNGGVIEMGARESPLPRAGIDAPTLHTHPHPLLLQQPPPSHRAA